MNINDIWNNIQDFFSNIKNIITDIKDLFITLVSFFPSPFKEILLASIITIIIVIIYKIIKN